MAQHPKFEGSYIALVTPFTADGKAVDYQKLDELVEFQIKVCCFPTKTTYNTANTLLFNTRMSVINRKKIVVTACADYLYRVVQMVSLQWVPQERALHSLMMSIAK